MTVDVAINVYGKPFQTAVALLSLMRHSGEHINKIYFVKEPKQPGSINFDFISDLLPDKLIVHTPTYWHWYDRTVAAKLAEEEYRRSLRYQYAWEESSADYLFVTHNDVLYHGDIVGDFLANIGDSVAIGEIGQCWNCPAHTAQLCSSDRYSDFRPSHHELLKLYREHPTNRVGWEQFVDDKSPWPLPECRINEWAALIDLAVSKPETIPLGDAFPFGGLTLDVGTRWFRDMASKGYSFVHRSIAGLASHGWAAGGAGHQALFQYDKYELGEAAAYSMLVTDFGVDESVLANVSGGKWRTRLQTLIRKTPER